MRRLFAILGLALCLSSSALCAADRDISGIVVNSNLVSLDYELESTGGVYIVYCSENAALLGTEASRADIGVIVSNGTASFEFEVPPKVSSMMFRIVEQPDMTMDEFALTLGDYEVQDVDVLFDPTVLPDILTSGSPFAIEFQLRDSDLQLLSINGLVQLGLVDSSGNVWAAHSVSPEWVSLSNGVVSGSVTIPGAPIPPYCHLVVVGIADGVYQPLPITFTSQPLERVKSVDEYKAPPGADWHHPLNAADQPISLNYALSIPGSGMPNDGLHFPVSGGPFPVFPAQRGVVTRVGGILIDLIYGGRYVEINHGNGYSTAYYGLNSYSVHEHQVVETNDAIGTVAFPVRPSALHFTMTGNVNTDYRMSNIGEYGVNPHLFTFSPPLVEPTNPPMVVLRGVDEKNNYDARFRVQASLQCSFTSPYPGPADGYYQWAPYKIMIDGSSAQGTYEGFTEQVVFDDSLDIEDLGNSFGAYPHVDVVNQAYFAPRWIDLPQYHIGTVFNSGLGLTLYDSTVGPRGFQLDAADISGRRTLRHFDFGPRISMASFGRDPTVVSATQTIYVMQVKDELGWIVDEGNVTLNDTVHLTLDDSEHASYSLTFTTNGSKELSLPFSGHGGIEYVDVMMESVGGVPDMMVYGCLKMMAQSERFPTMSHEIFLGIHTPAAAFSSWPNEGVAPLDVECLTTGPAMASYFYTNVHTLWTVENVLGQPASDYQIVQSTDTNALVRFTAPGLYYIVGNVTYDDLPATPTVRGVSHLVQVGSKGPIFNLSPSTGYLPQTNTCMVTNYAGFTGLAPEDYDFEWQVTGVDPDGLQLPQSACSVTGLSSTVADITFQRSGVYTVASVLDTGGRKYIGQQRALIVGLGQPQLLVSASNGGIMPSAIHAKVVNSNDFLRFPNAEYRWYISGIDDQGVAVSPGMIYQSWNTSAEVTIPVSCSGTYTIYCELEYGNGALRSTVETETISADMSIVNSFPYLVFVSGAASQGAHGINCGSMSQARALHDTADFQPWVDRGIYRTYIGLHGDTKVMYTYYVEDDKYAIQVFRGLEIMPEFTAWWESDGTITSQLYEPDEEALPWVPWTRYLLTDPEDFLYEESLGGGVFSKGHWRTDAGQEPVSSHNPELVGGGLADGRYVSIASDLTSYSVRNYLDGSMVGEWLHYDFDGTPRP